MREYRNAAMDNARWTGFEPRTGDILVCTPAKCGTTWMQTVVANLIWPDGNFPGQIVERCSFESMRNVEADTDAMLSSIFEGGIKGFIFKGTNGRWRDVLTEHEIAAYRRRVADTLPPDAARFIEHGLHAVGIA